MADLHVAAARGHERAESRRVALLDDAGRRRDRESGEVEGPPAGEQLEEEDAQRVDVAAGVRRHAAGVELLGRHRAERPDDGTDLRREGRLGVVVVAEEPGDAEVEHDRPTERGGRVVASLLHSRTLVKPLIPPMFLCVVKAQTFWQLNSRK